MCPTNHPHHRCSARGLPARTYSICYVVGAAYIDVGSPFSGTALSSLFASSVGVKAVGGYLIVAGLMLMILPLLVCYNLAKNKVNKTLSAVSWATSCIVVMFIFTSAVLAAQLFNPASKHLNDLSRPFSFYGTDPSIQAPKPEIPSSSHWLTPL